MNPSAMPHYLAAVVPLVVLGVFWLRFRGGREVEVSGRRLARGTALISALIAFAFLSQPHHDPGMIHWLVLAAWAAVGAATGIVRARSFAMRHDGEKVVMRSSSLALVILALLLLVRTIVRERFSAHSATVLDASLVFAWFMITSQRLAIWLRARHLLNQRIAGGASFSGKGGQ